MIYLKSAGAIIAGFLTVVVFSIVTDKVLEASGVFPPMLSTAMLAFALLYRTIYTVLGGYITAWLAPEKPMRLVYILAILGTLGGVGGAIAGWNLSEHWYPVALAVLAFPSVWAGGYIFEKYAGGKIIAGIPTAAVKSGDRQQVTLTRVFDMNRQRVWEMWTKPALLAEWWGVPPLAATIDTTAVDLRVGGIWRADMVNAIDGTKIPFSAKIIQLDPPKKLVMTMSDPTDPTNEKVETLTVTFQDLAGTTNMMLHQKGHLPVEQYEGPLQNGYSAFFERMSRYLRTHQ